MNIPRPVGAELLPGSMDRRDNADLLHRSFRGMMRGSQ